MERAKKRIAIIGGGVRGLSAAYEINRIIQEESLPFEFILLEKRSKLGGMVKTLKVDGNPIDVGAASFDIRRMDVLPFLKEVGLLNEIQYSSGEKLSRFNGHQFIFSEKPTYHGIPFRFRNLLHDPELSFSDKLAVLMNNRFNSKRKEADLQITTLQFLEDRFCKEIADLIAYPHYSENIYGSMELCPPSFFDPHLVELFDRPKSSQGLSDEEVEKLADGPDKEYRLKNGMSSLVERLAEYTGDSLETGKQVTGIQKIEQEMLLLNVNETEEIRVGSVISTIPLPNVQRILDRAFEWTEKIPKPHLSGMGTAFFQFSKGVIQTFPKGSGFAIPKRSSFHITKATILNRKWSSLADSSFDYLVVEFGRRQEETLIQLPDEAVLMILEKELSEILGLVDTYQSARVFRWQEAVTHFTLEERRILENMEKEADSLLKEQSLFIGANGLHGYGLPHAITEGKELAHAAIRYMKKRNELPT